MPPPVIVIVAVRELDELLEEYVAVSVALLLPLVGLTLSQLTLSDADQLVFDVTLKVVEPELLLTERLEGLTVRVTVPAWTTVTWRVIPPPVIVIVAVRELDELLEEYVAVSVALLLPLGGLTLSQLTLSHAVQLVFELIVNVVEPEALPTERLEGLTLRDGGIYALVSRS